MTIDNSEWIFAAAFDKAIQEENTNMMDSIGDAYIAYMMKKTTFYEDMAISLFNRPIPQILLIHANMLNSYYLDALLAAYRAHNYSFVSLPDALEDPAYLSEDTFVGNAGISWLDRWALTRGKKGDFFKADPRCPDFIQEYSGITE